VRQKERASRTAATGAAGLASFSFMIMKSILAPARSARCRVSAVFVGCGSRNALIRHFSGAEAAAAASWRLERFDQHARRRPSIAAAPRQSIGYPPDPQPDGHGLCRGLPADLRLRPDGEWLSGRGGSRPRADYDGDQPKMLASHATRAGLLR